MSISESRSALVRYVALRLDRMLGLTLLARRLSETESLLESLRGRVSSESVAAREAMDALRRDLSDAHARADRFEARAREAETARAELVSRVEAQQAQIACLAKDVGQIPSRSEPRLAQIETGVDEVRRRISRLDSAAADTAAALGAHARASEAHDAALRMLKADLATRCVSVEDLLQKVHADQSALAARLDEVEAAASAARGALAAIEARASALVDLAHGAQARADGAVQRAAHVDMQVTRIDGILVQHHAEIDAARKTATARLDEAELRLKAAERVVAELGREIRTIDAHVHNQDARAMRRLDALEAGQTWSADAVDRLDRAVAAVQSVQVEAADMLGRALESAAARLDGVDTTQAELDARLAAAETRLASNETKSASIDAQVAAAAERVDILAAQLTMLDATMTSAVEQARGLEVQLRTVDTAMASLVRTVDALKEEGIRREETATRALQELGGRVSGLRDAVDEAALRTTKALDSANSGLARGEAAFRRAEHVDAQVTRIDEALGQQHATIAVLAETARARLDGFAACLAAFERTVGFAGEAAAAAQRRIEDVLGMARGAQARSEESLGRVRHLDDQIVRIDATLAQARGRIERIEGQVASGITELHQRLDWLHAFDQSVQVRFGDLADAGVLPTRRKRAARPYDAVAVVSIGRTGSMWLWNVARDLLETAGLGVVALDSADFDRAWFIARLSGRDIICLHHHKVEPPRPKVRYIVPYRDIRDVALSTMRFNRVDFDTVLSWLPGQMEALDALMAYDDAVALKIRYEAMVRHPDRAVLDVATFLGISLSRDKARVLAERYSRERVRRLTQANDRLFKGPESRPSIHKFYRAGAPTGAVAIQSGPVILPAAYNPDLSLRIIDERTRFQTNHVSSKGPGEWRIALTAEQKKRLNDATREWLGRYRYRQR